MTTLRLALRPILAAITCASLAACANPPARGTDLEYRSRPPAATQGATSAPGQRLNIQTGEGERLNLPWFIQGTQNLINRQ
ncbi:hypothetical protein OII53_10585 [Achromobacter ruhlandii]|uniref:hypothetical protein n=1 Tax=Achromobacter ruhlandii TaxID=72557 RepID=UPI0021F0BEAE|nr:hypothetical protein [Achromobacter ruhlandii]MCV6797974.1 hypothetical protein [Achromobacter ruhlandii]MCV6802610.1 hypothetical protein [Achromobacter ruhlandii]MCV6809640.1 hypothetical protein [Achromobacter ruhlandii]MCV6818976.1 hypothetical protein [Achromobacter ruhlandii]